MIIEFNHTEDKEVALRANLNFLIKDTLEQSYNLTEIVANAPGILRGYATFRSILKGVKRGQSVDEAITINSGKSCPPNEQETLNNGCGHISCNECWKSFIDHYVEVTTRTKDDKNTARF